MLTGGVIGIWITPTRFVGYATKQEIMRYLRMTKDSEFRDLYLVSDRENRKKQPLYSVAQLMQTTQEQQPTIDELMEPA